MRRKLMLGLGLAIGASALSGCSEEGPTSLGGDLIGENYRTYEVVLDAPAFLQGDTTYSGLGALPDVPFTLVAEAFEDELFAHTLFRVDWPTEVRYESESGTTVTDTSFSVVGGVLTIVVDSLGDDARTSQLEVVTVTESWHRGTVSWEQRFDTAGVAEAWTEPGGTTGQRLGGAGSLSGDTIQIALDSASAAVWSDSAAAFHGGMIRSATRGTRLRIESVDLTFNIRPEAVDTLIPGGSAVAPITVVTPEQSQPDAGELRVGGVPLWRTAIQFQPLADLRIPCPGDTPSCTVPLSEVHINMAALLLQPTPVGSRRIERPFMIEGRAVLRAPGVPLARSPLSPPLGEMDQMIQPDAFTGPAGETERVVVPLTRYMRQNLRPPSDQDPILWVALLTESEQSAPIFGYAEFASLETPRPPQLRLVVTIPTSEEQ